MILQKNLVDIGIKLADYLNDNENIKDFCKTNFDKELTIFVGDMLQSRIPTKQNCPYIVITDLHKREGLQSTRKFNAYYYCTIYVGVAAKKSDFKDSKYIVYDGYDVLCNFMNLIQTELVKRNGGRRVPDEINGTVVGPVNPDGTHWGGTIEFVWKMAQTINAMPEEEF